MPEPHALTASEFEHEYAARSHVSVEWLKQYLTARPCDCGLGDCRGWQMISHEQAREARND